MSDIPTPEEVEAAAVTLEKMSRLYEYYDPPNASWCPADLRYELSCLRAVNKRETLITEIICDSQVTGDLDRLRMVLRRYDIRREE